MSLGELAEAAQAPARTIRFYIARGLLDGPVKGGRGAAYTADHLARLDQIRKLQAQGLTLSEIANRLEGGGRKRAAGPASPWWQHEVAEDVMVWTRADLSPWRTKQVRAAIEEFARRLQQIGNESEEKR